MKLIRMICLAVTASSMSGCEIAAVNGMIADAYTSAETPESLGIAPVNYRGKSCLELAIARNSAQLLLNDTGEHQDYVRMQGQWTTSSVQQVERETGCLPGTTNQQAGAVDYVLKHPQDLETLKPQLPPGGLEYIQTRGKLTGTPSVAVITTTSPNSTVAPSQMSTASASTSGLKQYCYIYMASDAYAVNPDVLSLVFQDPQANASRSSQVAVIGKFHEKVARLQPKIWRAYAVNDALCNSSSGHCSVTASGMFGPRQTTTLRCFDSLETATSALTIDRDADPTAKTIQP